MKKFYHVGPRLHNYPKKRSQPKKTFMTSGLIHLYHLDESISSVRGSDKVFIFIIFCIQIPVRKQCRPRSDPRFVTCELGIH